MTNDSPHLTDEIQDLLDGRLSGEERRRAETHIAACRRCARQREALRAVQQAVRRAGGAGEVPSALAGGIRAALDRERSGEPARPKRSALPWFAAAAVVLLAVLAALLLRPDLPARVAEDSAAYRAGSMPLEVETDDPAVLEAFFRERGVSFRTRVLDLRMMDYRLVGGRVHRLGERPSAFFVYRAEGNKIVVCQMYPGPIGELPSSTRTLEAKGMTFHVLKRRGETLVFWQEGDVACVLASDIPSEEVVALAVAKAMKA